jgi:predicted TIM-barrel fold metal-dependent hydrolase
MDFAKVSSMRIVDADGHVEESPATFSDAYLDPRFHRDRPQVVGLGELAYWVIDEQLFPRRLGRGCHNLGTPTSFQGKPTRHAAQKADSIESMELTDITARLKIMDEEGIDTQVLYPTLFLAYPLTSNPALMSALCSSYNRWLGDRLSGNKRLKWAGVVNLDDISGAVQQVRDAARLGAAAIMVLGTAGDRLLDDDGLNPLYEAVAAEDLPLAVHVGWACPSINNLFSQLYPSAVTAFLFPVLIGFVALISGGMLDRFPNLRVAFLEAGCMWIPFIVDRLEHRYKHAGGYLAKVLPQVAPRASHAPSEYLKRGNLYFSAEVEDSLLPQVLELVGEQQIIFGSDMPHGDRERFAARTLQQRRDITGSALQSILQHNPCRLYRI